MRKQEMWHCKGGKKEPKSECWNDGFKDVVKKKQATWKNILGPKEESKKKRSMKNLMRKK